MDHKFINPVETRYRTKIAEIFTEEKKLETAQMLHNSSKNLYAFLENL